MYILVSNSVVSIANANAIYVTDGMLKIETETSAMAISNIPENALQQVAEGVAENKRFIEFEDAILELAEAENEA